MGWLGNLLKIGGVVGAPFTGGASLALTGLGSAMSGMGEQAGKNRAAEADFGLQRNMVELAANRDYRDSQNDAYKNAMRSAYAMNWKPVGTPGSHIKNVFEGRTLPPEAMQAAQAMQRKAMIEMLQGKKLSAAELKKAGFWEKFANIGGAALGIAGSMAGARGQGGGVPDQQGMLMGDGLPRG
jgi:hypothetical protein